MDRRAAASHRKKILLCVSSMHAGGAERVAAILTSGWAAKGHDVTLVITYSGKGECLYALSPGVKVVYLADYAGTTERNVFAYALRFQALRKLIEEVDPDVVLSFLTNVNVAVLLASLLSTTRRFVVVSERIHPPAWPVSMTWRILRRLTYPMARAVVVLSRESLAWLREHIPGARGQVIPNPVQYPLLDADPILRPEDVVASGKRVVLAAGRLHRQKGFDCLLSAFALIAPRAPEWVLVILGEGEERHALEKQVDLLGLRGKVLLPGRVGSIARWYSRADLFVLSSRFEGFPNTLVEAMSYGRACVSYDCHTGPREIICDEVDGLLVRPAGDTAALARAMQRLIEDEEERQRMGSRAIAVRERFSLERILAEWEALFEFSKSRQFA